MSDYLRRRFPLADTSTVYMTGKAVYNLVRWGKPGHIADVELHPADADTFRHAVREAMAEAWEQGFNVGYEDQQYRDTGKPMPENPYRAGEVS